MQETQKESNKNLDKSIHITMYTKTICPYCIKAKALLDKKNAQYEEINIENDEEVRNMMIEKSDGRKTVPQIFINDKHIGGCDDLYALDEKNELDKILNL